MATDLEQLTSQDISVRQDKSDKPAYVLVNIHVKCSRDGFVGPGSKQQEVMKSDIQDHIEKRVDFLNKQGWRIDEKGLPICPQCHNDEVSAGGKE